MSRSNQRACAKPSPETGPGPVRLIACWNEAGVYGAGNCPELSRHIHCRNCPVYLSAGLELLNRSLPAEYRREWSEHFSRKNNQRESAHASAVLFRIALEWLALPTDAFQEVSECRQIHSLPRRKQDVVLGLANVRGELLICVSLGHLLRLENVAPLEKLRRRQGRLLVINWHGERLAFPVDHVHGPHRFHPNELRPAPATRAHSRPMHAIGILHWQERTVGLLEPGGLFSTLNGNLT